MYLNKELNIEITYAQWNTSWNEYYIIINKDNMETKYTTCSLNIHTLCSYINILLLNKVHLSTIEERFNLIKTKDNIKSIITKPKLNKPNKGYKVPRYSYFPKDEGELQRLVRKLIVIRGNDCSLNDIDVSRITNMEDMFYNTKFNGDISKWDVSNVEFMPYMFDNCDFNGDISKWNTRNVLNMNFMFKDSKFNGNISNWNTSNVVYMLSLFIDSKFNGDISNWNVSNVVNMRDIFKGSLLENNKPCWHKELNKV